MWAQVFPRCSFTCRINRSRSQKSPAEPPGNRQTDPPTHRPERVREQRHRMDVMKQVVLLLLLLAPARTCKHRCFSEDELSEVAERKLRSHYPQPAEPSAAAADSPASCPVELYRHQPPQQQVSDRSVSPWRYVLRTNRDHFPSVYAEAQCLCSGCILIQGSSPPAETHDYVSLTLWQSRVFLRRELCPDGRRYHLKPVTVNVAVGCTCARYRPRVS